MGELPSWTSSTRASTFNLWNFTTPNLRYDRSCLLAPNTQFRWFGCILIVPGVRTHTTPAALSVAQWQHTCLIGERPGFDSQRDRPLFLLFAYFQLLYKTTMPLYPRTTGHHQNQAAPEKGEFRWFVRPVISQVGSTSIPYRLLFSLQRARAAK